MKEIAEQEARERLRNLITKDYKQHDLAADLGLSRPYVGNVLNGRKPMTDAMLAKVGVKKMKTVQYFVRGEDQ